MMITPFAQVIRSAGRIRLYSLLFAIGLAACSSPANKADEYFRKGMALMARGDLLQARQEFQSALKYRNNMAEAWFELAGIAEKQADWQSQFNLLNKVVELDPKHLQARIKLGRMLVAAGKLDQAMKVSDIAMAMNPADADVRALRATVLLKRGDRNGAIEMANSALARDPYNDDALMVLSADAMAAGDAENAIRYLDRGIGRNERDVRLQLMKVKALEQLGRLEPAVDIIRKMIQFYPQNRAFRQALVQFYLGQGRKDKAEDLVRSFATDHPEDIQAKLDLAGVVGTIKGPQAAAEELGAFVRKEPDNNDLKFALATYQQSQSQRGAAEDLLKSIVVKSGDGADGLKARGLLAASLLSAGDRKSAQTLVTQVLAKDGRNEQALLLKAGMEIDDRNLDQAIADLRTILRDVPESARALMLLGKAHDMDGAADLAEEGYLQAIKASRQAAPYGIAYAEFLLKHDHASRAEKVLIEALAANPGNLTALNLLAQLRIGQGNWAGIREVAEAIREKGNPGMQSERILAAMYAAKKDFAASIATCRRVYEATPNDLQSVLSLAHAYQMAGRNSEALAFIDSVLRAHPGDSNTRLLQGQLLVLDGDQNGAARSFQTVIDREPNNADGYVSLANLYLQQSHVDAADKVIAKGLEVMPGNVNLLQARAMICELAGRSEEAIRLYESLLRERPNADLLANSLSSLLAEFRNDKASLNRAYDLAQRFKHSGNPAFKDTLGWAGYRLGKYEEAATLLRDAAKAPSAVPAIHYHLGMNYLALADKEAARKELHKALDMAGNQPFPQAEQAKKALRSL